jgi:hypothetical protein
VSDIVSNIVRDIVSNIVRDIVSNIVSDIVSNIVRDTRGCPKKVFSELFFAVALYARNSQKKFRSQFLLAYPRNNLSCLIVGVQSRKEYSLWNVSGNAIGTVYRAGFANFEGTSKAFLRIKI